MNSLYSRQTTPANLSCYGEATQLAKMRFLLHPIHGYIVVLELLWKKRTNNLIQFRTASLHSSAGGTIVALRE